MGNHIWSAEDDLILAEIIIKNFRQGYTLKNAFEEVAEKIIRTPGSCSNRWHSFVKQKYPSAIEIAKEHGKRFKIKI